ncbi:MAG TPA: hypothetical protein VMZ69_00675 [Saprospiraceae bacterium]|nr:hypothetical protein [Saprospiraceae bacterium]
MKENSTCLFLLLLLFYCNPLSAQWVKTNGPEGITVDALFETGGTLFCGTNSQGVYRSSDNGNTWVASTIGLELKWIDCFANDNTYIYAGVFGSGVYRSSDNGFTWQPANTGIQTEAVFCLLNAGGYLWAGTVGNGVFRSSDQGTTWINANGGALGSSFITAMFFHEGRINVEADNLVFFSDDFGNTWDLDSEAPLQYYQIYDFYQKGDTVFASGFTSFFRSLDGGLTWSQPYYFESGIAGFDRIGNTVYTASLEKIYYTNDWGVTWNNIATTGLRNGAADFIISGNNNFLVCREEIGIALSSDLGSNWTEVPLSQFARGSAIDDAIISANGILYSGTHGNGVFSSADQGNNWTKIGTTNLMDTLSSEIIFSILHIEPNIILAGGCGDGLFRSADNGLTWTHITAGLPVETGGGSHWTCIHSLEKCGSNILAACWMGVFYSTDNGLTWNPTNLQDPPENGYMDPAGFAVRGNIVCVGVSSFPQTKGIYRSTNCGITWTLAQPMQASDIFEMAAGGGSTMYAGDLFGAFVSHDDGFTWGGTGIDGAFTIIAWDEYALIGNHNGIFFSEDFGDTWEAKSEGLDPYPNGAVQGLSRDDAFVYAGTYRDAIWRRPLSDFGAIEACNMVTQAGDNGPGSLRDIVACAPNGTVITFHPSLTDQTINLTSGEIDVTKNLTITGLGMTHLSISGHSNSRIFHILPGRNLSIEDLTLKETNSILNGGAIYIEGHLGIENAILEHNYQNGLSRPWTAAPLAQIDVYGNVNIKN